MWAGCAIPPPPSICSSPVWEDVESIRAFAGERWQEAVIAPDEEHLLKDTWIQHYDTLPEPE